MRAILDTHILIWAVSTPERLPFDVGELTARYDQLTFSVVSIWEIAIKFGRGRADFTLAPELMVGYARQAGLAELPVTSSAALRVATLPHFHRDPFDRLLIAQAIDEDAVLLTADATLASYGSRVLMLGAIPSREA